MRTAVFALIVATLVGQALVAQQPAPAPAAAPPETLDFELFKTRVQPIFLAKREGLVRCVQCHGRGGGGGSAFTLQPLPEGATTWNDEQSRKNFESAARLIAPGSPAASRLLMHPLAREAGGDPFHGGGRHWASQNDAEWQILAQWANSGTGARRSTTASAFDFEFYRTRVEPIFTKERESPAGRASCAGCHASVATRFRLQPLPAGSTSWPADQSRQNFEVATQLVTPGDPLKSRLLLHPLAPEAGGDSTHTGGKFWKTQDDPEWQTLAAWVRTASASTGPPSATATASAKPLDYEFFKTRVQPMFLAKRTGLVRCVQCHGRGGGSGFPLQPLAEGVTMWSEEQTRKNFEAASRLVAPGNPTASRLLMHPLARDAGGDPFHGGGKHWSSQSDREWQVLAAWVRGETVSGSSR